MGDLCARLFVMFCDRVMEKKPVAASQLDGVRHHYFTASLFIYLSHTLPHFASLLLASLI